MKDLYIQGIFNQYMGKRDEARADLDICLANAVGVGGHSNLGEEIKKKIEEVDKYDSVVRTMQRLFSPPKGDLEPPTEVV